MIAEKRAADDFGRDQQPVGTPMWKLLVDPYIAIIAGALVGLVGNFFHPKIFLKKHHILINLGMGEQTSPHFQNSSKKFTSIPSD